MTKLNRLDLTNFYISIYNPNQNFRILIKSLKLVFISLHIYIKEKF